MLRALLIKDYGIGYGLMALASQYLLAFLGMGIIAIVCYGVSRLEAVSSWLARLGRVTLPVYLVSLV